MSSKLIERNDDLRRLRDKGFNIRVEGSFLVVRDIPYVTSEKTVKRDGVLVTELTLSGDVTIAPERHQMRFVGSPPCDAHGVEIYALRPNKKEKPITPHLTANVEFSNKPSAGYKNFYDKVSNYAAIVSGPACALDSDATPFTRVVIEAEPDDSPFHYLDTASAKAEISVATQKLAVPKLAIVGLGGTGSYILDLIAKTPVREIHLYDGDSFSSHNAFRAPGAPSLEELRGQQLKVEYFHSIYSKMHRGIVAHPENIDATNVEHLIDMNCVFLSLDGGPGKRLIVETLEKSGVPFIDAAMGLYEKKDTIGGSLQVTTSTPANRDQARARISLTDADDLNEYDRNIQVADLNALNAQLAVLRWKKMCGFYHHFDRANFNVFTIGTNQLLNEDLYDGDQ